MSTLTICVLASGSSGNCVYVASPATRLLIDAGLTGTETQRRLAAIGVALASVGHVCVSHEHDDHKAALGVLQRKHGVALYANSGTIEALRRDAGMQEARWNTFTTGSAFQVGDLTVDPFSVPHDSYDPVGFVVGAGDVRVGVVTDIGMPTELVRQHLRRCQAVVLECNHDIELLKNAKRPWSLKQRILGRQGHLSNEQAADLICAVASPRLRVLFLAHLSSECNNPVLAQRHVRDALNRAGHAHVDVKLTYPDRASDVVVLDAP